MGNPRLVSIKDKINLRDFLSTSTNVVTIEFHQQDKGNRYYRLKCVADSIYSSSFPTTYLYLGSYSTDPQWVYTVPFSISSVKNSSFQNTSFEALFTQFPSRYLFTVRAYLESSSTSGFASYETSSEYKMLTIELVGDNFGPTWSCPTWIDEKYSTMPGVAALTGLNKKGAQATSNIRFNLSSATGRYGTTVESYSINVNGGFLHNLTPSHVQTVGTDYLNLETYYKLVGDVTVEFSVTDSRGMRTVFTRKITIVPYKSLYLTDNDTHRQGGTGSTLILNFSGKWHGSPLTLTCTGIEAKEEGSSSAFASLTPSITVSGSSFSYNAVWSGVVFDPHKAYTITATFTDTIRTIALILPVPVGTPVLSIRDAKVGINNPSPNKALDVVGLIGQNGYPILGFVKEIVDETSSNSVDLNSYITPGFYIYQTLVNDVYHFPSAANPNRVCMVEVIGIGSYLIQKLFYLYDGETYIRAYNTYGWNSWKKVTMT